MFLSNLWTSCSSETIGFSQILLCVGTMSQKVNTVVDEVVKPVWQVDDSSYTIQAGWLVLLDIKRMLFINNLLTFALHNDLATWRSCPPKKLVATTLRTSISFLLARTLPYYAVIVFLPSVTFAYAIQPGFMSLHHKPTYMYLLEQFAHQWNSAELP